VVIAAPEYAGAVAGAVKNALDWVVGAGHFYGKPVVVLSAGTTGGANARRDLVRTLSWQGAHVVAELGIAAPLAKSDTDGRFTDPETVAQLIGLAELAAAAALLPGDERIRLVGEITAAAGVGTERIAPILA
jgi:NAD(P)H-dependent FMN reductase